MRYSDWNSVVEYLTNNLRTVIESGQYEVGERFLTEREICEKYSVGRSSAREALRVLEALGWIRIIKNKGAYVSRQTQNDFRYLKEWYSENAEDMEEILAVRALIEPQAAAAAAKAEKSECLENLIQVFNLMEQADKENNVMWMIALDEEFHVALVDCLKSKYLSAFNAEIQKKGTYYRAKTFSIPHYFNLAQEEHRRIMKSILEHDVSGSVEEIRRHIISVRQYFFEIVEEAKAGENKKII